MATYTELYDLSNNSALKNKIAVAVVIAANTIRGEAGATTNHANRLIWAASALANPGAEADRMLWGALAQNSGLTVAQITNAADSALQTAVNNAVDLFATGA
jgi:hypothetical protein